MPTYEYVCAKCEGTFDVFQSMSDPALKVCPKESCVQKKWGRGKVRRAIGAGAGLIFKGSGFYITDYRSENYKAAAKSESGTASKPAAAETKAATSTVPKAEKKAGKTKEG